MADEIDRAQEYEATLREAEIRNAATVTTKAVYTGFCLSCGQPIAEHGRRWCDAGRRDDWERIGK